MPRARLMTPGPVPVSEESQLAQARQVRHHRTAAFRQVLAEVQQGLKYVFRTENDVAVLTSSGTGAMECAVVNAVARGGKAIVLESGKFSERWRRLCEAFAIRVVRVDVPWGEAFTAQQVQQALAEHPDAEAVFATLSESSTGVGHDIESIGRVVRPTSALLAVDAISGAGVMPCLTDAWGIDLLVVGSQKALRAPPGLAFVAVSTKAWQRINAIEPQAFYFDLRAYRKSLAESDTPYTPAISLVTALAESLRAMRAEGMEAIWSRAAMLAEATRAGIAALGLRLVAQRPADGLTAVYSPDGVDGKLLLRRLEERFGLKLAGGQGPLKGRAFRLAHLGLVDELDILATLAGLELVLVELGQSVKLGTSVAAASEVFARHAASANAVKG